MESEMLQGQKMLSNRALFVGAPSAEGPLTIGGTCSLPGAKSPINGRPLLQYAEVRLEREGFWIEGWRSENIHFLYSWKCSIMSGYFSYRQADGAITVLEVHKSSRQPVSSNFPYAEYPEAFEARQFQFATEPTESTNDPLHQFGGTPIVVMQWVDPKACIGCGAEMPLAATLGDRNFSTKQGFVRNSGVQIVYWVCPTCQIVAARNYCD
jgi:hypothetical protein